MLSLFLSFSKDLVRNGNTTCIEFLVFKEGLQGFKGFAMFSLSHFEPGVGYWYIIWKIHTKNRELNLKNTSTLCLWGWWFHVEVISLVVTCTVMFHYCALLDLPDYWSDPWRRFNLRCSLVCQWRIGKLVWSGVTCGWSVVTYGD